MKRIIFSAIIMMCIVGSSVFAADAGYDPNQTTNISYVLNYDTTRLLLDSDEYAALKINMSGKSQLITSGIGSRLSLLSEKLTGFWQSSYSSHSSNAAIYRKATTSVAQTTTQNVVQNLSVKPAEKQEYKKEEASTPAKDELKTVEKEEKKEEKAGEKIEEKIKEKVEDNSKNEASIPVKDDTKTTEQEAKQEEKNDKKSNTIYVKPGESIQAALNAASSGDTIIVKAGTYYENLVWPSTNNLSLISEAGSKTTILDGSLQSSVIFIGNNRKDVRIEGFTIKDGYGSSVTFHKGPFGGGICIDEDVTATVKDCWIKDNGKQGDFGVGVEGGAVFVSYRSVVDILGCIVENNIGRSDPGIYYRINSSGGSIKNCVIRNNGTSGAIQSGIFSQSSRITIENNIIHSNGTGIAVFAPMPTIRNNIIMNNYSGGIYVWQNPGSDVNKITYNDIYNNSVYIAEQTFDMGSNGNISQDPLFQSYLTDYHLKSASYCVDAGDPSSIFNDLDGSRNDMGIYGGMPLYVSDSPDVKRIKYIISVKPDVNGNIYRHFMDEDWGGQGHGRPDKEVKEVADSDGATAYQYFYHENSNVVRIKYCYSTADYTNLDNPALSNQVATFEYVSNGALVKKTTSDGTVFTHYLNDANRLKAKTLINPDSEGFTYYEYLDEDYNGNGCGRISKKQKSDGSYELMEYWDNTENIKTHKKYDKDGQIVESKKYEYDENGNLIAWANEEGPGLYIRVQNTGQVAITAVCLSFDRMPYDESSSYYDFQLKSPRTGVDYTNVYFPVLFDDAHPLNPGQSFDTLVIPELTGIDFRMSNMSIGGYGQGMSGSGRLTGTIVPGVTMVDFYMIENGKGMCSRFSFLYSDSNADEWYYLSGRLKSEKLLDGTECEYDDTDVDDNGTPNDPSDDHGRLIKEKKPDGSSKEYSDFDDANNPRCIKEYDAAGNLIKKTVYEEVETGWVAEPAYMASNLAIPGSIVDFYYGKMDFFDYSTNTLRTYNSLTGTIKSAVVPNFTQGGHEVFDHGQMAWYGLYNLNQPTSEIFWWNGTNTIRLTNNSLSDEFPFLSNGQIAWNHTRGGDDIWFYNGTQIQRLTNSSVVDDRPDILNGQVTWESFSGGVKYIYLYDGTITKKITNGLLNVNRHELFPKMIGKDRVIWGDRSSSAGNNMLYAYNGSSIVKLSDNFAGTHTVAVGGGSVVWAQSDGNDIELFLYDGIKTTQLTNNNYDDSVSNVSLSDGRVVWAESDGHDGELFLYDGKEKTQLTNNDYNDLYPWISGKQIGWLAGSKMMFGEFKMGGIKETIYEYDSNGVLLTQAVYLPRGDEEIASRMGLESTLTQGNSGTNYTQTGTLANPPDSQNLLPKL